MTQTTLRWLLVAVVIFAVVALAIWAHGPKHHEGDEVGTHGTDVYAPNTHVVIVP